MENKQQPVKKKKNPLDNLTARGRPKGTPNKLTHDVRTAIQKAFLGLGGVNYLIKVGHEDPKTFCQLLGKVVPSEVNAVVTHTYERSTDDELRLKLDQMIKLAQEREQQTIDITPQKPAIGAETVQIDSDKD